MINYINQYHNKSIFGSNAMTLSMNHKNHESNEQASFHKKLHDAHRDEK